MPVNNFVSDSFYIGTDYQFDFGESVDGVDQNLSSAVFAGGIVSADGTETQNFTFAMVDDFTIRASLNETETSVLTAGNFNMTVRIRYQDGTDRVLINGAVEAKRVYF